MMLGNPKPLMLGNPKPFNPLASRLYLASPGRYCGLVRQRHAVGGVRQRHAVGGCWGRRWSRSVESLSQGDSADA